MNRTLYLIIALAVVFLLSISGCSSSDDDSADDYDFDFETQYWQPEVSRLKALGCDTDSPEAYSYQQCLLNKILEDLEQTGHVSGMWKYQGSCHSQFEAIPGCLNMPYQGTSTYSCDVSREAEGTYNDEYCPLGHSVELNIVVDWKKREFTYKFHATCIDTSWSLIYDFKREVVEETSGGGTVTDRGWLLGEFQGTITWSYECGPPRYCGKTGSPPEDDTSTYSKYVVGHLVSIDHLEMGFQNQSHPMDQQTLSTFSTWLELENASRGSKFYDCFTSK